MLGLDDRGREVLSYLPGTVIDVRTEALTLAQLAALAAWTRAFHAAVAGFAHPGPWRTPPLAGPTLIGHNDLAPWNACFEGDALAGVFDWDLAGPPAPLHELAFLAWTGVPLWHDPDPAVRPRPPGGDRRRLRRRRAHPPADPARRPRPAAGHVRQPLTAGGRRLRIWRARATPLRSGLGRPVRNQTKSAASCTSAPGRRPACVSQATALASTAARQRGRRPVLRTVVGAPVHARGHPVTRPSAPFRRWRSNQARSRRK